MTSEILQGKLCWTQAPKVADVENTEQWVRGRWRPRGKQETVYSVVACLESVYSLLPSKWTRILPQSSKRPAMQFGLEETRWEVSCWRNTFVWLWSWPLKKETAEYSTTWASSWGIPQSGHSMSSHKSICHIGIYDEHYSKHSKQSIPWGLLMEYPQLNTMLPGRQTELCALCVRIQPYETQVSLSAVNSTMKTICFMY